MKYYKMKKYWAIKKNYILIRLQIGILLRLTPIPKKYVLGKLNYKKFTAALK